MPSPSGAESSAGRPAAARASLARISAEATAATCDGARGVPKPAALYWVPGQHGRASLCSRRGPPERGTARGGVDHRCVSSGLPRCAAPLAV
jgi:hypothetical protein